MSKLTKNIIKRLPLSLRKKINQASLNLNDQINDITFKVAESVEEVTESCKILHDSYVHAGFMNPTLDGLRILPQFFLPSTVILIAKFEGQVIGTMSLIRDNIIGLPMEKIFDLSALRKNGSRLTEVSSLAIHPDFRKKGGLIFHHFIRFVWNYSLSHHGGEYFVIAVNPTMVQFYEDFYLFKRIPDVKFVDKYDFVKGAPAIGLYTKVDARTDLLKEYQNKASDKNLYKFMFENYKVNKLAHDFFDINASFNQNQILQYFLNNKISWWSQLDEKNKYNLIRSQAMLGRTNISFPNAFIASSPRAYARFDSLLKVLSNEFNAFIYDVSQEGVKIRNYPIDKSKSTFLLATQVGPDKLARLKLEPKWTNEVFNGYRILDADQEWLDYVQYLKNNISGANHEQLKSKKRKIA